MLITNEQTFNSNKTHLDGIAHEQAIIRRQLFVGQVVRSWPMIGRGK